MFALLGGWHGLALLAAARTARGYDRWRQHLTEVQRFERAVVEAALTEGECDATAGTPAENIRQHWARLEPSDRDLTVTSAPTAWPWTPALPMLEGTASPLATPTPALLQMAPAELRRWLGSRVEISSPCQVTARSTRAVPGQTKPLHYASELLLVSIPLTRFGLAAYELPTDLGRQDGPETASAGRSDLPAGLVPGRDAASRPDWLAEAGTLPYHHRRRASVAAAYQRFFSQAVADRLAASAGTTHFHDLDRTDPATTAQLEGLTRTSTGAEWDLGRAGRGRFGAEEAVKSVAVVVARTAGRQLVLRDTVGAPAASALLLICHGPADQAAGYLQVHLETILRPVMIVGYRVRLSAAPGAVVRGALLLDPGSTLAPGSGGWRVAHLSYPASQGAAGTEEVQADEPLPPELENWIPRARFAAATTRRVDS